MGTKTWQGIYARKESILIYFTWNGKAYRERLAIQPNPRNMTYASRMRDDILVAIERGTFSIGDFFPDSKHANESDNGPIVSEAIEEYLKTKSRTIAATTMMEYKATLNSFLESFATKRMGDITFAALDTLLKGVSASPKTYNNTLSCVRGLFKYAILMKWIKDNPILGFEFSQAPEPAPDPLDRDEMEDLVKHMHEHLDPQIANYFEGAMWLGWRPSEGISLKWGNVDMRKGILRIDSARVRGIDKGTKTAKSREVELDERALELLRRQALITKGKSEFIFLNPTTGARWYDTSGLVVPWRASLAELEIRNRDARQARHTCATMLLMAGCNPAWCAAQLGHSMEMFLKVYSKWLVGSDRGRERSKLMTPKVLV